MRINANHWMEVNTSGGMDELVTWIKGPTFRMKKRLTDLKPPWNSNTTPSITQWQLIQSLGIESQADQRHLGWTASLFDRSDKAKLELASTDVARSNIGRTIKNWWIKRPAGLREAGWPYISMPCAQLRVEVTSANVPACKPRIGSSTDLQSTINSSPHLTSKARRIKASLRRSVALHISLENRERGEVRVRRGAEVSAPLQLCASEE